MEGRDSNPRPRHYEPTTPLKVTFRFNDLPTDARCDWHDEAQQSTTDSRRSPASCSLNCKSHTKQRFFPRIALECFMHSPGSEPAHERQAVGPQAAGLSCPSEARRAARRANALCRSRRVDAALPIRGPRGRSALDRGPPLTQHTDVIRSSMAALRALLINGAPFVYPPICETTIGSPTRYAVPPLSKRLQPSADLPSVCPYPEGTTRGQPTVGGAITDC
jgi:hypothetical protein